MEKTLMEMYAKHHNRLIDIRAKLKHEDMRYWYREYSVLNEEEDCVLRFIFDIKRLAFEYVEQKRKVEI